MIELSAIHVRRLEESMAGGAPLEAALPAALGNTVAD
jgi:hypothetical protein